MSSRFPDDDTFQNHFNDLISFFKPPSNLSWVRILVVEEEAIIRGKITHIPKSALISAHKYEKRFDELLHKGYDWINMNAMGILHNSFLYKCRFQSKVSTRQETKCQLIIHVRQYLMKNLYGIYRADSKF